MPHTLPPEPAVTGLLARGREAAIYTVDESRVLRRYDDPRDVRWEVAAMRHARRHGVPVPAVHSVHAAAMVIDRVDGPTMVEAMAAGTIAAAEAGRMLAELHGLVHRVPLDGLDLDAPAAPGDVLVHTDLHPANVMLTSQGPVIIDWAGARVAPAAFDVAMTAVLLAEVLLVGIDAGAGDVADLTVDPDDVRALLDAYLGAVATSPVPGLAQAVAFRSTWNDAVVSARAADLVRETLLRLTT